MATISIIVPVYNTEQYLPRCIDSILNQSFTDFELLLIDDGSTDGSGRICDSYGERDNRIRVFHKENGGVSSARNVGLDNANGEWIYFVDSDDEVMEKGLQTLIDCISSEVDIVLGGFVEVGEDGNSSSIEKKELRLLSKRQSIITSYYGYDLYYKYLGYLWIRLLRNNVIQENGLRFDTSIAIKEDTLFLVQYVCKSNGITRQTTIPVYKYYIRHDSAMGNALGRFNLKYVDSFYAFVKMKHEIEAIYSPWSETVYVAKQGIYGRYADIINILESFAVKDDGLKERLYDEMKREVGSLFLFKVRRKMRKIKKKIIG